MSQATKDKFFKASLSSRDKAENTTMIARAISDAEAAAREAKTARLKRLRLAHEAAVADAAAQPEAAAEPRPKAKAKAARARTPGAGK